MQEPSAGRADGVRAEPFRLVGPAGVEPALLSETASKAVASAHSAKSPSVPFRSGATIPCLDAPNRAPRGHDALNLARSNRIVTYDAPSNLTKTRSDEP